MLSVQNIAVLLFLLVSLLYFDIIATDSEFNEINKVDIIDIIEQTGKSYVGDGSFCSWSKLEHGRFPQTVRGKVARVTCRRGYWMIGKQYTVCIGRKWTPPPICLTRGCPITSRLLRASSPHRQTTNVQRDTVLMFSCDSGYVLQGQSSMYCYGHRKSPHWVGTPPACVIQGAKSTTENVPASRSTPSPTTTYLPTLSQTSTLLQRSSSTTAGPRASGADTTITNTASEQTTLQTTNTDIQVILTSVMPSQKIGHSPDINETGNEAITESMAAFQNELGYLGNKPSSRWLAHLEIIAIVLGCILFVVGVVSVLYLAVKRRTCSHGSADEYSDFRFQPLNSITG